MSRPPSNHLNEKSTVAISVGEAVRSTFGDLPEKQSNEIVRKLSQVVERYSSPYPDAEYLSQIERLSPGATKEIIASTIKHMDQCHQAEMREFEVKEKEIELVNNLTARDVKSISEGRWLGFAAYIALLLFSGAMYYLGAHELAYIAFGASALSIVSQIIGGRSGIISIAKKSQTQDPPPSPPARKG